MSILTDYQKAALEYKKHISLTANAGSGKTTVLAKRYVEILLQENLSLNNIVAITFTDKAASELYSKIAAEINNRLVFASDQEKNKLEALRRNLVSSKISTIHAFCIEILKDFAPEAGIDANFMPIDARTSEELLDQSIDEIVTDNLYSDSKVIQNFIRLFGNKAQLIKTIKVLFRKRKTVDFLISQLYTKEICEISECSEQLFESKIKELFEDSIKFLIESVTKINSIAEDYKRSEKQIEINRLLNELRSKEQIVDRLILLIEIKTNLINSKGEVYKRGYLSNNLYDDNTSLIEEINKIFNELELIEIDQDYKKANLDLVKFSKELSIVYNEINERYSNKKYSKSYLDFEDLLLLTQELLKDNEIIENLSTKYKFIMVDEYQDTNEIQYNIFMPILKNLSSGNLFVVGDEKQSIYMFREAEVKLFQQTKLDIENWNNSSSTLELPHSFRLAPNVALFINILFRKLFKAPNNNFNEVEYSDLVCAYQYKTKGKVELLIAEDDEIQEAELVASKIISLKGDPSSTVNYSDIAILCTKRKSFIELENSFSNYGIPFTIIGGKGFYQQQLIYDIYNYLSFLINPKDDLALACILRSPYFGLSDVQLTKLSFADGNCLFDKLIGSDDFPQIVELLNRHLDQARILSPNELIRTINRDTAYWSYLASKTNGVQEIANLEKLIIKSISINEHGFNSLFDLISYLKESINTLEDEGQAEVESADNAVKIMTIHQSKGLEFKTVIIYKANQKRYDEKLKSKEIAVDKDFGLLTKLPPENNFFEEYRQAPIIGLYNYIQKKKSEAEFKRLLYVALTRAEEQLIISMGMTKEKIWQGSFAEMILNSFSIEKDFTEINLKDELTFMTLVADKYLTRKEVISHSIKITKSINSDEKTAKEEREIAENNFTVNTGQIESRERNEIISASKISLFLNCPRKYQLTYEFGYGELTKLFRVIGDYEFNHKEDEVQIPGNIVGNITHKLLENDLRIPQLGNEIKELVLKDENTLSLNEVQKDELISEIKGILENYYASTSYNRFAGNKNVFTEVEFYKKEHDYFLYGIIDKLIVQENKIIVIDYKSDKINSENSEEKKNTYYNQLLFYAYLLKSKYVEIRQFELNLIFLRDDNYSHTWNVDVSDISKFGNVIKTSVDKIRRGIFTDTKDGCKNMKYYLLNEHL